MADAYGSSDTDEVLISTTYSAPVANAGADQSVFVGHLVTLDGSASSDVDGDPLTFSWSLSSKPNGSTAQLSDPTAVKPNFLVDYPGTYVVQLIVNDGSANSAPDTVVISTQNSPAGGQRRSVPVALCRRYRDPGWQPVNGCGSEPPHPSVVHSFEACRECSGA